MTIGDIKAAALQMMGVEFKVDGGNVSFFMDDDNYGTLIFNMVMALNRGLADLEAKCVLPLKKKTLKSPTELPGGRASFSLAGIADLGSPVRVTVRGAHYFDEDMPYMLAPGDFDEDMPYMAAPGELILKKYDADADTVYELLYRPTVARVSQGTPDTHVLPIPTPLAEALPYFIKAEVFRKDEPGEANEARNFYEAAVAGYAGSLTYGVQGAVLDAFAGVFQ